MDASMSKTKIVHIFITLVLMFGIGFIPPFSQMTVLGMKILGVLVGAIYGITFFSPVWACLLAMAAFPILGIAPVTQVLSTGLGSDSIMLMLFFFVFVAVLEQNHVTEFMANWIISRKALAGRPWLFSYTLIVGTMLTGAFGSSFPAMMVFWAILISTCKMYDIKPFTKYPTVMFMGICIGGLASSSTWLFRGNPLFVNATLQAVSGGAYALNFGMYALFSFLMWMIAIAGYILACKYLLKVDVGPLADISDSLVDQESLKLTKRQKITMIYAVLVIAVYCFIGFTPASSSLGQYLATFGTTTPIVILLVCMAVTFIDGTPLLEFGKAAKNGVMWDTLILAGTLLTLATLMMTLDTGIAASLIALLSPVFAGRGVIFLTVIVFIVSVILTNFMANTTVGLMFTPVIVSFAATMGFNPLPVIAIMLIGIHIAFITPAASPFAAMLFGYTEWVKPTDIYKYGALTCLIMVVVFLVVGIPLSTAMM